MRTPELQAAEAAARIGGEIVTPYFQAGVERRSKDIANLVTDADIAAERAIVAELQRAFPDHAIIAEEEQKGDKDAEHLWVVDPIDGTNNFAHQIPHFAVSIAYYRAGQPQCGVIYNPALGDWYMTARGHGAWHNGKRVNVLETNRLNEVLVGVGFYYDRGAMMEATLAAIRDLFRLEIHGIRRFGTAALDLCMVGVGRFGAYFEYQLSPWDFAAGRLFVEEAGGTITDAKGQPLELATSSVLASNGHLHDAVLEVVRNHHP